MLKFFFKHNYSFAHVLGGAGTTQALVGGHYVSALVIFGVCVVTCTLGEHAWFKQRGL